MRPPLTHYPSLGFRCDPHSGAPGPRDGAALLADGVRQRWRCGAAVLLRGGLHRSAGRERQRATHLRACVLPVRHGELTQRRLGHSDRRVRPRHSLQRQTELQDQQREPAGLLQHRPQDR